MSITAHLGSDLTMNFGKINDDGNLDKVIPYKISLKSFDEAELKRLGDLFMELKEKATQDNAP